ncbi:R3H domain-containing protein 1 [Actinomortierella ambigua]|nr:R3H domain-containing protein 1 [Actinomortierella ambigua]
MAETLDPSDQSGDHAPRGNASSTTTILQADPSNDRANYSNSLPQDEASLPTSDQLCLRAGGGDKGEGSSLTPAKQGSKPGDEASTLSQTLEQLDLEEGGGGPFNATLDEFLMTALRSSKDRMFLLKLDREFGFFINDPQKNKLEFPTMNSYHRMVIHRVANYFNLRRLVHPVHKTVVLFKTEYSAIPSLRFSDLVEEEEEQVIKPVQLLRRNPDRATPTPSETSESAPEPERKTMSIKEREEAYARARARIFQETPSASKTPDSSGNTSRCDSPVVNSSAAAGYVAKFAEVDENDASARSMKPKKQSNSGGSGSSNNSISNSSNGKKKKATESQPGSPELVRSPDALDIGRHEWAHSNSSSRNVSRSGSPTTPTPALGHVVVSSSDSVTARKPKTKVSKSDLQMDTADGRRRRSTTSTTSSSSGAIRTTVGLARTESSSSSQDGHHSPGPTAFAIASPAAISPMHSASTPPKVIDYFGMDPSGVTPSHNRTLTPTQGRLSTGGMKGSSGQNYSGKKSYPPSGYNSTNMGHYGLNANTGYPSVPPHHGSYTHPLPTGPPPSQPTGPWIADPMQFQGPDVGSFGPGYSPGGPGHHPGHPQAGGFHAPSHQYKQHMDPSFQQAQQRLAYSHHQHHLSSHSQPHAPHPNYYHPQQPQHKPQQHSSFQHPGQQAPHHHHHQHYQPYFQPNHISSRAGPPNGTGGNVRPRYSQDHQFHRSPSNKRYNQVYDPNKNGPNVNGGSGSSGYYGSGAPQHPANANYDLLPPAGHLVGQQPIRPQGQRAHVSGGIKYHGKSKNQQHAWNGAGYAYQAGSGVSGPPWVNAVPFNGGPNGAGHGNNNGDSGNNNNISSTHKYHNASGYNVMSSPAHMYDIERRPPKSTELFDPNSPQSSSGPGMSGASSSHESSSHSSAMEGTGGVSSASDAMLSQDSYLQHQYQHQQQQHFDSANGPILMTRSFSSNSTTSSGQTPTPSSTGTGGGSSCSSSKKNLVYDYSVPMASPYEGVLKGPSQEKSMPGHILEVYGFHPEDDFVDDLALPAGAKLKHVKPAGNSGGGATTSSSSGLVAHGQYLVIFKNAAVASEALAAFQDGRETWLKKTRRLRFHDSSVVSSSASETQDDEEPQHRQEQEVEKEEGQGSDGQEEDEEPLRNTRFQVRVWTPVLVQSLLPTVGGPPGMAPHPQSRVIATTAAVSAPGVVSQKGGDLAVVGSKESTSPVVESSSAEKGEEDAEHGKEESTSPDN